MIKSYIILVCLGILILSGCQKLGDFGSTNTDPAKTENPSPAALLTNALASLTIDPWLHFNQGFVNAGIYCQYFSITENSIYYDLNANSAQWIYYGPLFDLQTIINLNSNESTKAAAEVFGPNEDQIAIARIIKAYIYWTITDQWGDIPYSEALKGKRDVSYDPQETIYKDLIKELTEAAAQFVSTGEPTQVQGDIAYNGEISKWKKLANSLRMLMALNLSKQYEGVSDYSAVEFRAALSDPGGSVEDNADNFQLNCPGGAYYRNPFYSLYYLSTYHGECSAITSLLVDTIGNDGRQAVYGSDNRADYYSYSATGVPQRDASFISGWRDENPDWCLIIAPEFRNDNSPFYLIKASNVLLARAEAADRGWTSENTESLYRAGITASFNLWNLEGPDNSYFDKPALKLTAPGTNLKQIAIQQYLAYYPDGIGGWNTWRRTGWPLLYPSPDAVNSQVIPRRLMYGNEDYFLTPEGVEEAVKRLGPNGDKMDSRMWWDK